MPTEAPSKIDTSFKSDSALPTSCTLNMPLLLLLKGQPGSGKSTLGRHLARRLSIPLIDKDDARDCFQALALANQHIDWNQLSYDVIFSIAESQLANGLGLILDCPLARHSLFVRAAALAEKVCQAILPLRRASMAR